MKPLMLLIVLAGALGCDPETEYQLVDPYCSPYVAVPGEPCRPGLWLDVPFRPRGQAIATCQCAVVLVEKK